MNDDNFLQRILDDCAIYFAVLHKTLYNLLNKYNYYLISFCEKRRLP